MSSSAKTLQDTLLALLFAYALDTKMKVMVGEPMARALADEARFTKLLLEQNPLSEASPPVRSPQPHTAVAPDVPTIPDMLLERYLADALDEGEKAILEDLLEKSPADRARLEVLRADSEAFLRERPSGTVVRNFLKDPARYALSAQERALLEQGEIQEELAEYTDCEIIVLDPRSTEVMRTQNVSSVLEAWFSKIDELIEELREQLARMTSSTPSASLGWTRLTRQDGELFVKLLPLSLSTGRVLWALILQQVTPAEAKETLRGTATRLLAALHQQMGAESIVLVPPSTEVMRTERATQLLEAWFQPQEFHHSRLPGLPAVLLEHLARLESSVTPLGPNPSTWQRESRDKRLRVTFIQLAGTANGNLWALLLQELSQGVPMPPEWHSLLTLREAEIAKLLLKGWDNGTIADELKCSVASIKKDQQPIFDKLGVDTRVRLIGLALKYFSISR